MKVPTTTNCCYFCSLRTGTLIIGWISTIFAILNVAGNITIRSGGLSSGSAMADGSWSMIIRSILQLCVAIGLLYGVYTSQKSYVLWFVMLQTALIIINIIFTIYALISGSYGSVIVIIITALIVWAIQAYLVIVVYSYYKEMEGHA